MVSLPADLLKQLREKSEARAINRVQAETDLLYREGILERARRDIVFFVDNFGWTFDPRPESKPHNLPFITYSFQEDYLRSLEGAYKANQDLLTDKSRDMGVTWMILHWNLWHWLFDDGYTALLGSRKEDLVDNWELDSLFGKLDYCVRRLPEWLLPQGFRWVEHRTKLALTNPKSGNAIQGESANQNFSRQGRYSSILLDEFAFWEWGDSVWTATADASPVRFVVSTPFGKNNKFGELRFSDTIKVKSLHWSLHPRKDQAWYERETKRRTKREIAQELNLDYESSGSESVFNLKTNRTLRDQVVIDPFEFKGTWGFRAGLDYGTRNVSAFHVFAMDYDACHYVAHEWRRNMEGLKAEGFKGSMVKGIAKAIFDCPYLEFIDHCRADPSLWTENQTSLKAEEGMTSIIQQITDEMVALNVERVREGLKPLRVIGFLPGAQSDQAAVEVVGSLWTEPDAPMLKVFKCCPGLIEELEDLAWEDWSEAQQNKRNIKEKIMDRNNHSWDVLKYYILSRHAAPVKVKPKYRDHFEAAEAQLNRESKDGTDLWV